MQSTCFFVVDWHVAFKRLDTYAQVMQPPAHKDDLKQVSMMNVGEWTGPSSCSLPTAGSLASLPLWSPALNGACGLILQWIGLHAR